MKIELRTKIYPLEAILSTCYLFIDSIYFFLDLDAGKDEKVVVSLKPKKKLSDRQIELLKDSFMNELLYSALRCIVSKNNKKIREYVVARALYSTPPDSNFDLFSSDEKLDYRDDPLGIAVPWEDKYGKNKKVKKDNVESKV
ncbi:MAG: His-Xaa-Ser system protein HxsD [Candidatus Omnitrophota bacterium]|nr:His-Xaa-Ser system protein HxsD [Candidatus Omnitrophota bacterium]